MEPTKLCDTFPQEYVDDELALASAQMLPSLRQERDELLERRDTMLRFKLQENTHVNDGILAVLQAKIVRLDRDIANLTFFARGY